MPANPTPAEGVVVPVEMIEAFRDWYALHRGRPIMKGKARKIVGRILAARPAAPTQSAAQTGQPVSNPHKFDDEITWLREAARYFSARPTGGEDRAFWANVYNAENANKLADRLAALSQPEQSQ